MQHHDPDCVWEANGEIEAHQVRAFLRAHDIPSAFRGESVGGIYGFTSGVGVVRICVPSRLAQRARELLAQVEAGTLRLPDADAASHSES